MGFFVNKLFLNILTCGMILSFSQNTAPLANIHHTYLLRKVQQNGQNGQNGKKNGIEARKWKSYTFADNGFSVELPTEPEHVHQTIDIPKVDVKIEYDTYISELSDAVVYVISVWHYPAEVDMSKPEVNLQDGFGGMLSALPGAEVNYMKLNDYQGFKALDFKVKKDAIIFQGKLILVHNTLYQVFTVFKADQEKNANVDRFIKSFKLINPERNRLPQSKDGFFENAPARKMNVYNALPKDFFSIQ